MIEIKNTKEYQLTLLTLAPVFIGSDTIYSSKEYIYENNQYYFPEMYQLYQFIQQNHIENTFEKFLCNSNKRLRLIDFFNDQKIKSRDFGGFRILVVKNSVDKPAKLNDINGFIKDELGHAYIPGSSLKGALRTLVENQNHFLSSLSKDDKNLFWSNVQVSDSEKINNDDFMISQKWDLSYKKDKPHNLPLFRESIKPLKKIKFNLRVTSQNAITIFNQLEELADKNYQEYSQWFLKDFNSKYIQDNPGANYHPLYLGAGSGVWTKVNLLKKEDIKKDFEKKFQKSRMKFINKGTLKLTKVKNIKYKVNGVIKQLNATDNFYEMGKCAFNIDN